MKIAPRLIAIREAKVFSAMKLPSDWWFSAISAERALADANIEIIMNVRSFLATKTISNMVFIAPNAPAAVKRSNSVIAEL